MAARITFVATLIAFVLLGTTTAVWAQQSLADIAKKEEERRQAIKVPAKVYTNADLKSVPPPTAPTASPSSSDGVKASAASPATDKQEAANDQKDAQKAAQGKTKDQAYWSGRLKELRAQLDRDQTYAEALQSRINSLATDFVNRDDPAQRAVIAQNRQKAIDELARLQQSIQNDKKAIADLEEEARKAGVPPG